MEIKVYGAFRSGTNYLKTLLETNFDVRVVNGNGGFKHAPIPGMFVGADWTPPPAPTLGVVKDPWSWLPSMWRYVCGPGAKHTVAGNTWDEFLRSPLTVYHGGLTRFPHFWFRTPMDYWLAMATSLQSAATVVVRYESALATPEQTCNEIAVNTGIESKGAPFRTPEHRTHNMADRERRDLSEYVTDERFDASYYANGAYVDEYTDEQIDVVAQALAIEVTASLGYRATGPHDA